MGPIVTAWLLLCQMGKWDQASRALAAKVKFQNFKNLKFKM